LPFADSTAPSLVTIVAGVPVAGSWWGHPAGQAVYRVGEAIESDKDVLVVRLWRGKLTLVHRRLWPALLRVGGARADWQMEGLSAGGRHLLSLVEKVGLLRSDALPPDFSPGYSVFRPALRDLERRLLVLTRSVHTPRGAHALEAESWLAWRRRVRTPPFPGTWPSAQRRLEAAARFLQPGVEPRPFFPWGRSDGPGTPK